MRFREIVAEGGNVFGDNTDRIARENIQPTLDRYFAELQQVFPKANINPNDFHPVGSVGQKSTSGDIDLAIDATVLFPQGITSQTIQAWNIHPEEFVQRFDAFQKRARSATDDQIVKAFEEQLLSAAERFQPDFILISAGFDSRVDDLLGCFSITDSGFRRLTRIIMDLADSTCEGRIVSLLEGGYNVDGLAMAVEAHVSELLAH